MGVRATRGFAVTTLASVLVIGPLACTPTSRGAMVDGPPARPTLADAAAAAGVPVVLLIDETGRSGGRERLVAAGALESAATRCQSGTLARGYVMFRASLVDTRLVVGEVLEASELGGDGIVCLRDALAAVPLRTGGLVGEIVIYVRLP